MDRKQLSLRCDPEQYSIRLRPLAMCNHSCIGQDLACYSKVDLYCIFGRLRLPASRTANHNRHETLSVLIVLLPQDDGKSEFETFILRECPSAA